MRPLLSRALALSARARIVGWMLLLVTIALIGSVSVSAVLLGRHIDDSVAEELTHEADSFGRYADSPGARAETTVKGVLRSYLEDKVPDSGETFFTLLNGKPELRSPTAPPARLDTDKDFIGQISGHTVPVSGWWDSEQGPVRYGVIPVSVAGDLDQGSLVILQFRDARAGALMDSVRIYAGVAVIAVALAGLASWLVAGRVLEPVRLVRQTAEQISETDLDRRIEVSGRDDVARLAGTFNRMLDRLQDSFDTQRQFLDDAGHELRTPITVVRGHLEVAGDDPSEWRETKALVLDELDRMRRIVEELVELARTDRPGFLDLGPVELADLTVDALANARVLGDREWRLAEVGEGKILADGQRLTQALMQLLSNALRHTGQGDTITVGSRVDGDRVLLWVADTGAGVADADAPHVFERFRRGTAGPRSEGAGLGLSIVASIAQAHGGTARLERDRGSGATFVLDLPLRWATMDRRENQG